MAALKSKLVEAADRVWKAFLKFGPVDDGRPEGDEFEDALLNLRQVYRKTRHQTSEERASLVEIVNAFQEQPEPCHYKIRDAINKASKVLDYTDLEVTE